MTDISKLTEILKRSKAVMSKTENEYGSTSNNNGYSNGGNNYSEKEMPNLTENFIRENSNSNGGVAPKNGRYRNLEKSKMPDFIKQAMIDNPINIPETPYHTFELDDVSDLVNESKQYEQKQPIQQQQSNTPINENVIRKIVREEIEDVVRDVIGEYLDNSLVTEDIQIRVGNTTFSGNLKPLPKKKKRR